MHSCLIELVFHIQPERVPRPHKRSAEMKKDKVKMSAKRAEDEHMMIRNSIIFSHSQYAISDALLLK